MNKNKRINNAKFSKENDFEKIALACSIGQLVIQLVFQLLELSLKLHGIL